MAETSQKFEELETMGKMLIEQGKSYEVVLSTKDRIKCDAGELSKLVEGIKSGSMIRLKQGLVNPSFIVTITLDEERTSKFAHSVYDVLKNNRQAVDYNGGAGQLKLPEFRPLNDIFEGVSLVSATALPDKKV